MSTPRAAGAGRVIVVGSVNIDLVMRLPELPRPGETVLGGVLARHHGGKGANQAVAAARAGADVVIVGAVGREDGSASAAELQAEGIDVTHVLRADAPTGTAAILVDANTAENLIAVASGANELVTRDVVNAALTAIALRAADVVVLSFELPGPALHQAADLAQQAGAQLVVNPAPAQPELVAVLAGAIATPNEHELAAYLPRADLTDRGRHVSCVPPGIGQAGDTAAPGAPPGIGQAGDTAAPGMPPGIGQIADAALALSASTGGPVLVTLGADGALLAADGRTEHFAGHRVDAVDTTGAGDTLTGVLAASLAAGYSLHASVRRAVAAAALSVTKAGARAGMPGAAAIDSLAGS